MAMRDINASPTNESMRALIQSFINQWERENPDERLCMVGVTVQIHATILVDTGKETDD